MFAREFLSLHTARLSVPKTLASKSCVPLTSKLIQTKALQVLYSGHLRKTGGRGSYRLVHTAHHDFQRGLPAKSCYSRTYVTHRGWGYTGPQVRPLPQLFCFPYLRKNGGIPPAKMSARRHSLSLYSQSRLPSYQCFRRSLSFVKKPLLCVPSQRTLRLCGESLFSFLDTCHSRVRRSFCEGGSLPWTNKRQRSRRAQRTPSMLQFARSGGQHPGEQLLCLIEGKGDPEEIGAAAVGVFFVADSFARGEVCENVPGSVLGE